MRLPQKGNWVKIDSDNLGNFNPLVDNQFCRGVLGKGLPPLDIPEKEADFVIMAGATQP